jgi:hypothetical protein
MAIIVVGGSNRGVGKTTLVCGLIAALPEYRWNAVKITTHDHPQTTVSPDGSKADEGLATARDPRAPFFRQIFERRSAELAPRPAPAPESSPIWEETTPGEETDTGRYLAAGAMRALLVSAPDGELSGSLNQLWPRFGRGTNLIFESNSVVHHVRADVCLLIHAVAVRELPLPERKPSFISALCHADALVSQAGADKVLPDRLCLAGGDQTASLKPIFQLRSLERVSPELLDWVHLHLPAPLHF